MNRLSLEECLKLERDAVDWREEVAKGFHDYKWLAGENGNYGIKLESLWLFGSKIHVYDEGKLIGFHHQNFWKKDISQRYDSRMHEIIKKQEHERILMQQAYDEKLESAREYLKR
jgi:hypothetical protein